MPNGKLYKKLGLEHLISGHQDLLYGILKFLNDLRGPKWESTSNNNFLCPEIWGIFMQIWVEKMGNLVLGIPSVNSF